MKSNDLKTIYVCFPEGKNKVLTMSFDDGREEDRILVRLFEKYGIKGTFNLNSGIQGEHYIPKEDYKQLYGTQEIACHTVNHPTLSRCPLSNAAMEVLKDREALEKITGKIVSGLAYPNGVYTEEIARLLPSLGIRYARTIHSTYDFEMPQNWFQWNPTCHFLENLGELGNQFLGFFKRKYLYMMYVWGHSYELEEPGAWEKLERFCVEMSGKKEIWYATNGEIEAYMANAAQLRFSAAGDRVYNPGYEPVWLEIDDQIKKVDGGSMLQI